MIHKISPWLETVPDRKQFSELSGNVTADVVVVGGGIVGLFTAWKLAKLGKKVVLLEKNHLATGDTALTTGFLSRVPDTSIARLEQLYGLEFVNRLIATARGAQQELFELIEKNGFQCDFQPAGSFVGSYQAGEAALQSEWSTWNTVTGDRAQFVSGDSNGPFAESIRVAGEGQFHSRKFVFELVKLLKQSRVAIYEESEAIDVETGEQVTVRTREGAIRARSTVITTGLPLAGFSELHPLVEPWLSFVLTARYKGRAPLPKGLFWDTSKPYFYYRLLDDETLMLGGCDRPLDHKSSSGDPYARLEAFLHEHFPGTCEVTNQWSGSLFETADGLPYAFEHPHYKGNVFVGTGLGGNGLVFGNVMSQTLADLVMGEKNARTSLLSLERTAVKIAQPTNKPVAAVFGKEAFVKIALVAECSGGKPICKKVNGKNIVIFKIGDAYQAIDNVCSHAGGSLCDGTLEGKVIECPLHGAKFDVSTGEVKGPPAVRPQERYLTRVVGADLEVHLPALVEGGGLDAVVSGPKLKKKTHWGSLAKFSVGAIVFWLLEFLYQYKVLIPDEFGGSLVRSFALAGATLIGLALFSSAMFKWVPRWAQHWRLRRYLGVSGFIFILFHVVSVLNYLFGFDVRAVFYTINPFENPIIFGVIAFFVLFALAVTSTDWMVDHIGPKRWKFIHRFVYLGYIASIFHFIAINPSLLKNLAGYVLLLVTTLAVVGQLFWYLKTTLKRKFQSLGSWVGFGLILLFVILGSAVYKQKFVREPKAVTPPFVNEEERLDVAVEKMKDFMKENPEGDPEIAKSPVVRDQSFEKETVRSGSFQNLNYMTSGSVTIQREGNTSFVVFGEDFITPDGPDIQVYLTKNVEPTTRSDIRLAAPLGKVKSLTGKQVYPIPSGIEVVDYHSISIHCKAFNVPWSWAPLN